MRDENKDTMTALREALEANRVFHTPLAMRRAGGQWNEFEIDAIRRTAEALRNAGGADQPRDELARLVVDYMKLSGPFDTDCVCFPQHTDTCVVTRWRQAHKALEAHLGMGV